MTKPCIAKEGLYIISYTINNLKSLSESKRNRRQNSPYETNISATVWKDKKQNNTKYGILQTL